MAGHSFGSDGKCGSCGESKESYDKAHADDWKNESYGEYSGRSDNGKCFPYSALINTPQGKVKIGDTTVGQTVWSYHEGILVKRAITTKLVFGSSKIMQIDFEGIGSPIRCAPVHSFLTSKGYLALPKIVAGDSIVYMDANGNEGLRRVAGITDTKTREPVFNLYTQGEHNFIVDGYVAHNFTRFRALRTVFHRLFLDGQIETSDQSALQH